MSATRPFAAAAVAIVLLFNPTKAIGDESPVIKDDIDRVPVYTVMPDYPPVARRDRIEGEVQVCFEISRSGKTRRIAVRRSTNRLFEKAAIRAVRASTYVPLSKDAALSGIKACRTFRFTLEPVDPPASRTGPAMH